MNAQTDLHRYFQELAQKWPSSFVARERIGEFSGGLLSPGRMANLDSQGQGPLERVRVGRKVAYPVKPLIQWMLERSEILD
ncbi:MAG: hypothetical protein K9K82_09265 [Desulfobacteraceae bacterium]|nr:hypothetical protein [Desulfobacteraceae bacterium]